MRMAMIRTKYFPLLFLAGGVLFAALFLQFYGLVFEAIDDIFEQQNATALQHLRSAVEKSHGEFLRQTKILHQVLHYAQQPAAACDCAASATDRARNFG